MFFTANRKNRSRGQASDGHWKRTTNFFIQISSHVPGNWIHSHGRTARDGSRALRQTPTGLRGGRDASSFITSLGKWLSQENRVLVLGLRNAGSSEDLYPCIFTIWGSHIEGEKAMKKEGMERQLDWKFPEDHGFFILAAEVTQSHLPCTQRTSTELKWEDYKTFMSPRRGGGGEDRCS